MSRINNLGGKKFGVDRKECWKGGRGGKGRKGGSLYPPEKNRSEKKNFVDEGKKWEKRRKLCENKWDLPEGFGNKGRSKSRRRSVLPYSTREAKLASNIPCNSQSRAGAGHH